MSTKEVYISYAVKKYRFEEILKEIFGIENLNTLHSLLKKEYSVFNVESDQNSEIHKKFYSSMKEEFIEEYEKFIKEEILPRYREDIYYQRYPTFRVSLPGNVAVGGFHKDSDYNHSKKEINYFLPFTKSYGTNTLWYQKDDGKYHPMECQIGQYVEWDGANTMHGNKINDTGLSRVSIDFRVITVKDYEESEDKEKSSITTSIKFDGNNYWRFLKNEKFGSS